MSALSLSRKRRLQVSAFEEGEKPSTISKRPKSKQAEDENVGSAPLNTVGKRKVETQKVPESKHSRTAIARIADDDPVSQSQSRTAQRCGKIMRMQLQNFMCHGNLVIDFHPRVNFLVGTNGSGKSAILAALVLGMGGRAKATNRSESMKQLIKTGENSAKIEITISNNGTQAYEPETYGNTITIVRSITQSSASYSIKDEMGRVISKKIGDLQRILMYHNIQVDNPVFVLNQDHARDFLKDLEPSKNYKFFLKATQIEMIMDKLTECLHAHRDQVYHLRCFKEKLKLSENEINQLKAKLKHLLSFEKLKERLRTRQVQHLWALVEQQEKDLDEFEALKQKVETKKEEILKIVENKSQMEEKLKEDISNFKSQIDEKNVAYTAENTQYGQLKAKFNKVQDSCMTINGSIDKDNTHKAHVERQIEELQKYIEERTQTNVAEIRERNEKALSEVRQLAEENTAIIEAAKRDLKLFIDNKAQKEEQMHHLRKKKSNWDENIRRLSAQINTYKASGKDRISIYGPDVKPFLQQLQQYYDAGKLEQMPRGPIGHFIEVRNSKYRDVIEQQIGSLLQAYVVSSKKDRLVLETIRKHKFPNYHPTIITTRFINQVYDVRKGYVKPPQGTFVMMDEIKCSDPVVMNCLIDRISIESILLTESKETAEHITSERENVPYNLRRVIVPQYGMEYHPDPHYRMYSLKIRPARFLRVNVQERIKVLEAEQKELLNSIQSLEDEVSPLRAELGSETRRIEEKRAMLARHTAKKLEQEQQITELVNFEYPDENAVDYLKRDLAQNEKTLEELSQKFERKAAELCKAKAEKKSLEAELKERKDSMEQIQADMETIKTVYDKCRATLRNLNDVCRQNQIKLKEFDEELRQFEIKKAEKKTKLNSIITTAQEIGDRVKTDLSTDQLVDDIQKIKIKLKLKAQEASEDPKKVQEMITAKEHSLQVDRSTTDNLEISIDMLKKSLLKRFDFMKKLKQHMVLMVQFSFNYILKMRNFAGSIEADHKAKTLSITVVPHDSHMEGAVDSTKALSGGERSYSTLAFLISLWSCVDHPFYFLDEYDVFTDEVNREYMTRLLINEGKKRPYRQYSFLTPQDMAVVSQDFIKIHRFSEPDRR